MLLRHFLCGRYAAPLAAVIALFVQTVCHADVVYSTPGSTYSQSFETLANTGTCLTWSNNVTLTRWSLFTAAGSPITSYDTSNDGGLGNAKFYSFGTLSSIAATSRWLEVSL